MKNQKTIPSTIGRRMMKSERPAARWNFLEVRLRSATAAITSTSEAARGKTKPMKSRDSTAIHERNQPQSPRTNLQWTPGSRAQLKIQFAVSATLSRGTAQSEETHPVVAGYKGQPEAMKPRSTQTPMATAAGASRRAVRAKALEPWDEGCISYRMHAAMMLAENATV